MYLCHTCSCHEILRMETPGQGVATARTSASAAEAGATGWYVAAQSENGRDHYVRPVGTVVVAVGRQSIREPATVEVECA
jgi:hypothetical protein